MNLGDIHVAVQRQFGDDVEAQIKKTDITRWANQAAIDIARKTHCLQEHAETDSVPDDGSYELPSDFIALRRVTYDNKVLLQTTLDVADHMTTRDMATGRGVPSEFYVWDYRLYLLPIPEVAGSGNLDIWYVRYPVPLVAVEDVPEIPEKYHEMLVQRCLSRAHQVDEDYTSAAIVMKEYEEAIMEANSEESNPSSRSYNAVRLLPGDDW